VAYVETPTNAAAIAAMPKNDNIMLFQVSSVKPSIRLTFLEKFVFFYRHHFVCLPFSDCISVREKSLEGAELAPLDRRSENVRVLPVVISELELGNIQRHIFAAHFVERADHAALEDRPEAFDGLSMDRAYNILAFGMVNDAMRIFAVSRL
jgi:hypothetical protein